MTIPSLFFVADIGILFKVNLPITFESAMSSLSCILSCILSSIIEFAGYMVGVRVSSILDFDRWLLKIDPSCGTAELAEYFDWSRGSSCPCSTKSLLLSFHSSDGCMSCQFILISFLLVAISEGRMSWRGVAFLHSWPGRL